MKNININYIKKNYSIIDIAKRLGIKINKDNKSICPFHNDTNPSLSFNTKENYYHCFACGEGGDNIKLVSKMLNCNFQKSIEFITGNTAIYDKNTEKNIINTKKKEIINKNYSQIYKTFINLLDNKEAIEYLNKRLITKEQVINHNIKNIPKEKKQQFHIIKELLKYYKEEDLLKSGIVAKNREVNRLYLFHYRHRLIIPYFDIDGYNIISIQGRNIDNIEIKPKYLFNLNAKDSVYNINEVGSYKEIVLCEGVIDCLSLERLGYTSISLSGASKYNLLYKYDILKQCNIYTFADNDKAGEKLIKNLYTLDNYKGTFIIEKFLLNKDNNLKIKDINELLTYVDIKSFNIDNIKYNYFEMPDDKICILDYYIFRKDELKRLKNNSKNFNKELKLMILNKKEII